jgi:hypothetical protein
MRLNDAVKAVLAAGLILVLNVLATTAVIFAYAEVVAPGRSMAFYQAAAPGIAGWTAPAGGAALLGVAIAWLGRRRPERNATAFALKTWIAYLILDVGSGVAVGDVAQALSWQMALSMMLALLGALAGAAFARRREAALARIP